jgi:cell division protein FtsN
LAKRFATLRMTASEPEVPMSDYNRGAYTPPSQDAPLAFDARRPVRGGSPAPVTLIVSALVLIILIGGAWFIYRDGFRAEGEVPKAVGDVVAESKTPPKADDQPKDETGGLQIYTQEDGLPPSDPGFAPAPETPLPRPTVPVEQADAGPLGPASPAPVAKPAHSPTPKPPAKTEQAKAAPVETPKAPATPAATPSPKASGTYLVQIGAFSSPALADKGWSDAAAIAPGAAAGKGKRVEAVESNGKTLYRTSVTGFTSRADADAFCGRLKSAGKSCFVR